MSLRGVCVRYHMCEAIRPRQNDHCCILAQHQVKSNFRRGEKRADQRLNVAGHQESSPLIGSGIGDRVRYRDQTGVDRWARGEQFPRSGPVPVRIGMRGLACNGQRGMVDHDRLFAATRLGMAEGF